MYIQQCSSVFKVNYEDIHLDTPTWSMLLKLLPEFRSVRQIHLGDGRTMSFWFDHWLGPAPLA